MAEHRSFKDQREYLLEEVRTMPAGRLALEKLKYLREEYDWAIKDYRNSLNILSDTTYEDRKHFLLELIQNADDACYINDNAELTFTILDDGLELRYNEDGFEVDDVIAITGTGSSTKSGKKNGSNSFIGEKGIGFKSVFALALEVEIESYPWHFKLLKERCIVPEVVYESHMKPGSGTRLKIKFSDRSNIDIISKELEKYVGGEVESFLFLQKLSKFNVIDLRNEESKRQTILLKPGNRKGELLTLNAAPSNKLRKYLLYNEEIEFSQELVHERWEKLSNYVGVLRRKISVAALIDSSEEMLSEGRLFCFLPTKVKLPIPIFLQIDGYTKADRERLHDPENNNWNKHLLSQIPKFLLGAILNWRENERIGDKLLDYIPMEDGEDQLRDVFKSFRNLLCEAPWVKTMDNNEPWIEPQNAIMADVFFVKWFENYPEFREEAEKILKKKFVFPKWCDKSNKRIKLDKYGVKKLSEVDAVNIFSLCKLPVDILNDNNITGLYKYLLDFQSVKTADSTSWRLSIERTKIIRSMMQKCRIFPMEGKGFTCLKDNNDDKVFWVGESSKRPTGIDGSFDLRMISNEYTYHVSISNESLEEAVKRASEINERNESLKQLLKFLKVQELTYDTLLTEVQMPWLLDNEEASEEKKFNIILSIFNVYKAKTVYDSEYIKMLSRLSEVKFLAEEGKTYALTELLLPKFLKLSNKDSIFESCGYKTLHIPFEIIGKIANKLVEFRNFLICCGIKVDVEFTTSKVKFKNSSKFRLLDEIRYKTWRKSINADYNINNFVEVETVELENAMKKYLEDLNCDIYKVEEVIYSAWVKGFEGNIIDKDAYYYKINAIPGFFKATYVRRETKNLLIKDELWAGVKRELIPVRTINGEVVRCNEAFTYNKVKEENLNMLLFKLPVVLVKESKDGQGYKSDYLESLEVRKISLKDLNQLWNLVQEDEYENILKLALELKNSNLDDAGFMIYDKEYKRLRPIQEFKLGTVSSEGAPLISLQYGEVGEALGKAYKLREESNLDFYKGIFTKVFSDKFKEDKNYQMDFYYLLKSWMHWNSVDRGKIATQLQNTLKEMEYLYEPVVLFNNEELLNTFKLAGVLAVNLVVERLDNEFYELEKAACDLGFILPDESGELVLIESQQLSEEENYEFKRLLDEYCGILELTEISRLRLKLQNFGGIEEIAHKIIKVDSAYRIFDRNSGVKIPIVLTFLDQKEKRVIAYKSSNINKLIEDILVILEFTTRRSAHRDLEEIQKQFITEGEEKTIKEKKHESISGEIVSRKNKIDANMNVSNRKDLQSNVNNEQNIKTEEKHYNDISEEVANDITDALIDERECITSSDIVDWDLGILPDDEDSLKEKLSLAVKESLRTGPEIYEKKFRKSSKQNVVNGIELSSNQKLVDRGAVNPKEFLYAEYKGKCQLCGTELDLHNGEKFINVYHIVEKKNGAWWADRPFNILGLCPNCNTLAKYGGKRDISNIFVEAKDLLEGNTFAIEVPEFKGDYYVASVKINGQYKELKISKLHLLYFSALLKLEQEEVEGEIAASNEI